MMELEKKEEWLCRLEDYIGQYPVLSKVYIQVVIKWLGLTRLGDLIMGFVVFLLLIALLIFIAIILIF